MSDEESRSDETHHDLTPDVIAAAEALAGRPATSEAHRELMLRRLPEMRRSLQALRASEFAEDQQPALHFQPLGAPASAAAGETIASLASTPILDYDGDPESLAFATVADLARLLRAGKVTSRQLTAMYLARLKRWGPDLRCVVNRVPDEEALAAAERADAEIAAGHWRGPLHGIPYGAKDLFAWHGLPTTCGVKPYESQYLREDATVLRRLEEAGALLIAKLSMGELAMGDVWFGGTTRNPWRPEEGSSGSSAGSGSAVAAGLVGFALGTETWGSIISPSVVCGVTGLRPTFGRVPRTGAMALSWSMDKIGPMARGVEDCALIFAAIAGADGRDVSVAPGAPPFVWNPAAGPGELADLAHLAGLRIGIDRAAFAALEEQDDLRSLKPIYEEAIRVLEGLTGGPLISVHLPAPNPAYDALPMLIIGVEGAASFSTLIAEGRLDDLAQQAEWNWPNVFRTAATVPATEFVQAQRVRSHLQQAVAAAMADVDLYLTVPRVGPSLAYTNLTGHPEIVTRCGRTEDGLPVSLSLVGALYGEAALLRVALAYEQATPWHREWPRPEGTA